MANQVLYGFMALKDLFTDRVTEVGVEVVNDAIQQSVAEHNRQMTALNTLFVEPTTVLKVRFLNAAVARLQPLDEHGRAIPIKAVGAYDVAFPLQAGGGAWGANYTAQQKMTVGEAHRLTGVLLDADKRWMRDHVLAALFADSNGAEYAWQFTDPEHGTLNIRGLASADSVKYQILSGSDAPATDDHYLAQAAAIADAADPFPIIFSELSEHPENSGDCVVLFPTNLMTAIKTLADFRPITDPNIDPGANAARLIGSLDTVIPGELIGYHDSKVWLVHWRSLPDDYMIGVMTGGEKALWQREHPETSLQGFNRVASRDNHPFYESQWLRWAGFGAYNRINALVYRIGNAAYAVPTGYGSPMA